jgi:hypothetical protein
MTFLLSNLRTCLICIKLEREESCRSPYFPHTKVRSKPPLPIIDTNPSFTPGWGSSQQSAYFMQYNTTASAEFVISWLCHVITQRTLLSYTHGSRLGIKTRRGLQSGHLFSG